jgi:1,4-dihydroxy-2-naphthoyl-CoA hydrolase
MISKNCPNDCYKNGCYPVRITMHDIDAAGVLFYGHLFRYLHDAYEVWMRTLGFDIAHVIRTRDYALPIVQAAADYQAPVYHGDELTIKIQCTAIKTHSFCLAYQCHHNDHRCAATATTTHVCIAPLTGQVQPLPTQLAQALEFYRVKT